MSEPVKSERAESEQIKSELAESEQVESELAVSEPPVSEPVGDGVIDDGDAPRRDELATDDQIDPEGDASPTDPGPMIVGIGASAGGLEALDLVFRNMPICTGMVFVVVQHLSPDFKSHMDQLLGRVTDMEVQVVDDGIEVVPNTIYLIPPRKGMVISDGKLRLTERTEQRTLTHPIDQFLESLAEEAGSRAVGVILSGTGSDGSFGIEKIASHGGLAITQEPATCRFDSMPINAQRTGSVHLVLPPEEIGNALVQYDSSRQSPESVRQISVASNQQSGLRRVFQLLQRNHGVDFSHYKSGTVDRRIARRIELLQLQGMDEYVQRINEDPEEINELYKDLLIGVTKFFRDSAAYSALESNVLPDLIQDCNGVLRIWVCGCATGEEAYTIGMLVTEAVERCDRPVDFKVFATDAHRGSLQVAATGAYTEEQLRDVSYQRRERFFQLRGDRYHIDPELRRSIVFAPQNVVSDPPFTQMNLVTCRNMLIYLQPPAQQKVLAMFHFALRNNGYLFLGPSESIGPLKSEFETIVEKWRIYRKKRDVRLPVDLRLQTSSLKSSGVTRRLPLLPETTHRRGDDILTEAYDQLLGRFMPPGVLVDSRGSVLHVFEGAKDYLVVPTGRSTNDLVDMVPQQIRASIVAALQHAIRDRTTVRYGQLESPDGDSRHKVRLVVEPITLPSHPDLYLLVQFEQVKAGPSGSGSSPSHPSLDPESPDHPSPDHASEDSDADQYYDVNSSEFAASRIEQLEQELSFTSQNLQATIEELETSNEELQATNEEMVAANEELQSTNEELHSVNEELYTVNAEHQARVSELDQANSDMNNLLATTHVGVLFLDEEFYIRRFTPEVGRLLNIDERDIGRNIDVFSGMICEGFVERLRAALQKGPQAEWESEIDGVPYFIRGMPYQKGNQKEGVVVSLVNVEGLRKAEHDARQFKFMADENVDAQVLVDEQGKVVYANKKMCQQLGYELEELLDVSVMRYNADHDKKSYLDRFELAHARGGDTFESLHMRKDGSVFPVEISITPVVFDKKRYLYSAIRDITQRNQRDSQMRLLSNAVEASANGIVITDYKQPDNPIIFVNDGFVQMTGFSEDEAVGRNCRFLQGDQSDPDQVAKIRRAIDRGESVRTMIKNYRKDGTEFWNDLYITPVTDEQNKITNFVGVQSDVSDRIEAGEAALVNERTIRLLLDSTAEGLFGLDPEGTFTFCNESAARMLGYESGDELIGLPVGPTLGPRQIVQTVHDGQRYHSSEDEFRCRDGSLIPVEYWCHPLKRDDQTIGGVVTFVNIAERLDTQRELTQARDEATAANVAKSRFLANMSHELRTPLSAILGFTRIIQEEYTQDEDLLDKLSTIQRNGDYLLRLLGDVLDLSRIESDKFQTNRAMTNLGELLDDLHRTMQMRTEEYNNRLEFELCNPLPATVTIDPARMRQVLINLIANALKFTPDGVVTVRVEYLNNLASEIPAEKNLARENFADAAAESTGDSKDVSANDSSPDKSSPDESSPDKDLGWLKISVIDNGIGIAADRIEQLFEPFVQGDQTITQRFGGTGLGLSITRRLVSAMDGLISVESQIAVGSRFSVKVPVHPMGRLVDLSLPHDLVASRDANVVDDGTDSAPGDQSSGRSAGARSQGSRSQGSRPSDSVVAGGKILSGGLNRGESERDDRQLNAYVLIADDMRDVRFVAQHFLTKSNCEVEVAENGRQAVDMIVAAQSNGRPYDLCLMDLQMPELDGIDAVTELRQRGIEMPIIALTADAMKGTRRRLISAGFDEYLSKPLDVRKLIKVASSLLDDQ